MQVAVDHLAAPVIPVPDVEGLHAVAKGTDAPATQADTRISEHLVPVLYHGQRVPVPLELHGPVPLDEPEVLGERLQRTVQHDLQRGVPAACRKLMQALQKKAHTLIVGLVQ